MRGGLNKKYFWFIDWTKVVNEKNIVNIPKKMYLPQSLDLAASTSALVTILNLILTKKLRF